MDKYAVMGNPIEHSRSPLIHSIFAEQTQQQLSYVAILVEPESFEQKVVRFFDDGGKGLNITVPFKQKAWALADVLSQDAKLAGAVNTLFRDQAGKLHGHNTDGLGLVRDIKHNHGEKLAGKKLLILGAGGAARGVLPPLLREQPENICIANRTRSKAEDLAAIFKEHGEVRACGLDELEHHDGGTVDWIINASSASLQGELPQISTGLLSQTTACYDLMYAQNAHTETVFCQWASQAGVSRVMDGTGMLVEQAAEAFILWRGVRPSTGDVIRQITQGV